MTALVLVGLTIVCAKLWSDIAALRVRIADLEWVLAGDGTRARTEPPYFAGSTVEKTRDPAPAPAPAAPPAPARVAVPSPRLAPIEEKAGVVDQAFVAPVAARTDAIPAARAEGFETLFGRTLPIWAGGVTLAVAGFLIVRYSIDAGLLSPIVRIVLGLAFGAALIAGAEAALRHDDRVRDPRVRQALAGAGIATLYASILLAADLYHLVAPIAAFAGLALVTVLAGVLSLRFGAPCAVLGLVGGLAAPALVGSATPDVPLLATYLALAIGGLCALSRHQRWLWLGVSALVGGVGWGTAMIVGGVADGAATASVGGYLLLIGIALPIVLVGGARGVEMRLVGGLAACVQIAALVATGGFGDLDWGLFALVSIALIWLSRREAALADLPVAGTIVALSLVALWPHPSAGMLGVVIGGIVVTYGTAAVSRVWTADHRLGDAGQIAVIALGAVALTAWHLSLGERGIAALALGAGVAVALVAGLGWRSATRRDGARFAIVSGTAVALIVLAAALVVPAWLVAPVIAIGAAALLRLAGEADDRSVESAAWGFATVALIALAIVPAADVGRAVGLGPYAIVVREAIRWLVPALVAALFAWRARLAAAAMIAQPAAVLLAYVATAQLLPGAALPVVTAMGVAALALDRRLVPALVPALVTAATIASGWAALPLATWLEATGAALLGTPVFVTALPDMADAATRLVPFALAAGVVGLRGHDARLRRIGIVAAGVLATISAHIAFKQVFALDDAARFVRLGMAERTVWELLLAAIAAAAWPRRRTVAVVMGAASLAHFLVFTAVLHDPLWTRAAVGGWPVANLLLPAYGIAAALACWAGRLDLPPLVRRARGWLQMALMVLFAASSLRQVAHGSLPAIGAVGPGEDVARSAMLIAIAVAFLRHGIARRERDWRIASLALLLVAVAKVFLSDTAGLDGLLRIASFAGLGFSLIGIGWLYARYLPATELTPDSGLSATPTQEN